MPTLASASPGASSSESPAGLLDGHGFPGATGTQSGGANHDDHVAFVDGRFSSAGCARRGFGDAAYEAWPEGGAIRFRAVTASPDNGPLAWEGVVRDDHIEASHVWTKERLLWTTRCVYWFRGARTDAPNPYAPTR